MLNEGILSSSADNEDNNLDLINEISLKKDSRLLITKSGNVISMNVQKPAETVIT